MVILAEEIIEQRLASLPGWRFNGKALSKQFAFRSFAEAMACVNLVAWRAEAADHHPDMLISYRRVTFTCSTHSEGGVTEKDFSLARAIEDRAAFGT